MNYDPHLYRQVVREQVHDERRKASLRSQTHGRSGVSVVRMRLSRFLVEMAFSVDPEAGRREFWGRATESEAG